MKIESHNITSDDELNFNLSYQQGPKRLLLIGVGPAAKRNYIPVLEKLKGSDFEGVQALVDLESKKQEILELCVSMQVPETSCTFIPDQFKDFQALPLELANKSDRIVSENQIDGVLILTEPKSHMAYLKWAINKNLSILIEKPISAPISACTDVNAAEKIWSDYLEIKELLLQKPNINLQIMTQRRAHQGFQFVLNYLNEFLCEYEVPLTLIDIFKSDGLWTFPHEYIKENHPFKYGYGMLLHGGYHFIDLLARLIKLNSYLPNYQLNAIKTSAAFCWPKDAEIQITPRHYKKLFPDYAASEIQEDNLGELDCHSLFEFKDRQNSLTHAKLSVMHNGFSRRAWPMSKADTYKGNGRVRHERAHIVAGPLLSLMVHSYEAYEESTVGETNQPADGTAGGHNHFDIQIFRNAGVIGGKPFESFSDHDLVKRNENSTIQEARVKIIKSFLHGENKCSWIDQALGVKLLSELAICAAKDIEHEPAINLSEFYF